MTVQVLYIVDKHYRTYPIMDQQSVNDFQKKKKSIGPSKVPFEPNTREFRVTLIQCLIRDKFPQKQSQGMSFHPPKVVFKINVLLSQHLQEPRKWKRSFWIRLLSKLTLFSPDVAIFYLQTWFASIPDEIVLHFVQPGRMERFAGSGMVITMSFFVGGSRRQTRRQPLA